MTREEEKKKEEESHDLNLGAAAKRTPVTACCVGTGIHYQTYPPPVGHSGPMEAIKGSIPVV